MHSRDQPPSQLGRQGLSLSGPITIATSTRGSQALPAYVSLTRTPTVLEGLPARFWNNSVTGPVPIMPIDSRQKPPLTCAAGMEKDCGGGEHQAPWSPLKARLTTKVLICLLVPFCMVLGGAVVAGALFSLRNR
ncbi:uncharacterized protein LOC144118410 [Amblyomma americanum]